MQHMMQGLEKLYTTQIHLYEPHMALQYRVEVRAELTEAWRKSIPHRRQGYPLTLAHYNCLEQLECTHPDTSQTMAMVLYTPGAGGRMMHTTFIHTKTMTKNVFTTCI